MGDDTLIREIHSATMKMTGIVGGIKTTVNNVKEDFKELGSDVKELKTGFDSCQSRINYDDNKKRLEDVEKKTKKLSSSDSIQAPKISNGFIKISQIRESIKYLLILLTGSAIGGFIVANLFGSK